MSALLDFELGRMNRAARPHSREQVAPGHGFVSLHLRKPSHKQPLVVCNLGEGEYASKKKRFISMQQTMEQMSHVYGLWTLVTRTVSGNLSLMRETLHALELKNSRSMSRKTAHTVLPATNRSESAF